MPDQVGVTAKGGTMRLGTYPCRAGRRESGTEGRTARRMISERHRHRYEFNNDFRCETWQAAGLRLAGLSPDGRLVEIVEVPDHPLVRGGAVPPGVQEPVPTGRTPCSGALCRHRWRRRNKAYPKSGRRK